ncbi:MAG TPA: alpha/beta fold hydrolase [Streptosporangiaceae bacterium]|jgi:alpha-beta hydrolase superfamily lysophospholipase
MSESAERRKIRFISAGTECAAWYYPGVTGACVIMTGGLGVPKEPGTDRFAARFQQAGFAVLAFDYRRIGESGGQPRLAVRLTDELSDWQAAITCAASLPGVAPGRLAIWGFSTAGGHVFRVAVRNPGLRAAIAQMANADGLAAAVNASRYQQPLAMLRFTGRAVLDLVGGWVGQPPRLVPLAGPRGTVALLTTPDVQDTTVLNPGNKYPDWQQAVAARAGLAVALYRPGRSARAVQCPLLVVACEQDQTALAAPAIRAGQRAPRGEIVRVPGGHYAPFQAAHEQVVAAEIDFLRRHLLGGAGAQGQWPVAAGRRQT